MTKEEAFELIKNKPHLAIHGALFTKNIFGQTVQKHGKEIFIDGDDVKIINTLHENDFLNTIISTKNNFSKMLSTQQKGNNDNWYVDAIANHKVVFFNEAMPVSAANENVGDSIFSDEQADGKNSKLGNWYKPIQEQIDADKYKGTKPKLSIKFVSLQQESSFYLITFTIESKNLLNRKGFIFLNDAANFENISFVEVIINQDSFSQEFKFPKSLFKEWTAKVIAKIDFLDIDAESKKIKLMIENKTCYCNRDFTVDEMEEIIVEIRDNTYYNKKPITDYHGDKLFAKEINLEENQKTYAKFTQVINDTFAKYKINTCLRKRHFLAQAYWETGFFTRLKEINADNKPYYPYVGRGFMQLTGTIKGKSGLEDNRTKNATSYLDYKKYTGLDVVEEPDIISNSIYNSADSGGWFWVFGKVLSDGSILNINTLADQDNFDKICFLVNGGSNGKQERTDANEALKKIIPNENCKNKK